ncbi:MAG: type IV secretory system conjugative DNA transfer family protein [Clostridia bacterium]|nr:type IV secretory system conjugative DNA transfer family protein [Clostridia bacterium]
MNWREYRTKFIAVLVVYIIVCVPVIGGLLTAWNLSEATNVSEKVNALTSDWTKYILDPITVLKTMFDGGNIQNIYLTLCAIVLVAFIYLTIKLIVKSRKSHDYEGEEHGSSDWSKNGEEYRKLPDGSEILNRKEGFILSKDHFLGTDGKKVKVNKNILVFGGSGTGKSACYVKPNIMQKLGSYVITDPKGELFRDTSNYLRKYGYDIKVLNLVETEFSNRYNPLAHIRDHADVDIIAHTIVQGGEGDGKSSDPFWDNTAKMLLKACIYYVISVLPPEEQNLSSCLNIVRAGGADESLFDQLFVGELAPEHPGRKEYEGIRVGADKTKQSIAISLVSKLSHFDSPSMQRLTTSNDIDFEQLGEKKTAIYVISPDSHSTYNYILTIFYGQLLQRLYAQADKNGGALKQPTYLLLDEFANIGKIPDFNQKLSTSRSRLISMSIIVQSLDQLVDLYKDLHENIISNCDTQIFLGSQSIKTCEYFSKSLGQKTLTFQNKSKSRDNKDVSTQGYSYSEQRQGRDLMTVDELKRLPMDDEILLVRGLKPIKAKKAWYYRFHPAKEEVESLKMRSMSEMPKLSEVEVRTMDVYKHLEERKRAVEKARKEKMEKAKDIEVNIDQKIASNESKTPVKEGVQENKEIEIDLQKELERKFDELFGSATTDDDIE